jgi:hypothetical protein
MGTRSVPDMQGIDQSKLVPLLTAALQEALTKIEAMEGSPSSTGGRVMSKLLVDEISDADNTGPVTVTDGLTVQGAFTSLGIDDNATSTAITLDASGNLLVGKTSAATNVQGGELRENGQVLAVATDINPFFGARLGSDGDLAVFRKDGTTVGSIGTAGGTITIDGGGTSSGIYFGENQLVPRDNGAGSNNVVDLGQSGNSFKDLYLSGGVYLGGTGSANKLDHYEEGTTDPSIVGGFFDMGNGTIGSYTRVGNIVNFQAKLQFPSNSNGNEAQITLPFVVSTRANYYPTGANGPNGTTAASHCLAIGGQSYIVFQPTSGATTSTNANLSGSNINVNITYQTTP